MSTTNGQLFDKFADIGALETEKQSILKIFGEVKEGLMDLSKLGINLDKSKGVSEMTQALKEYEAIQNRLIAAQARLRDAEKQLSDQRTQTNKISINGNTLSGDVQENIALLQKLKKELSDVKANMKNLEDLGSVSGSTAEMTAEIERLGVAEFDLKKKISDATRFIKNQVQEMQAADGSLKGMRAQLNQMLQLFDELGEADKSGAIGKDMLKNIQEITTKISQEEQETKRYFRNVGNYNESLAPLFETLGQQIDALRAKQQGLQDLSKTNPVGFKIGGGEEDLNKTTAQLQQLEQVQQIGFKTSASFTQQTVQLSNALGNMAKDGKTDTAMLQQLAKALEQALSAGKQSTPFANAFSTLKKSLDDVRNQLKDPNLKGEQLKKLQAEERLLTELTTNLTKTFTTSRQELRAFTEASVQLGTSFGATDERVVAFQQAVGHAKNEVDDLKKTVKFQSSDTKYIDGAVAAVNGLAGAYSAAEGAAVLFGDDNEQLQKTFVKLQALMTILNGLQAVQNALQTESGAVQTILAAKIGLVNAAKAIEAKLFGATAVAMAAEATAAAENAVALEATAAAQVENVAGAEAVTVAMEAETAATVQATAATTGLRTILTSSGILVAIGAIIAGVIFLGSKISDWLSTDTKKLENTKNLIEATKEYNDALVEEARLVNDADTAEMRILQHKQAAAQVIGTQLEQFAIRKKIGEENQRLAQNEVSVIGLSTKQQADLLSLQIKLTRAKQNLALETIKNDGKLTAHEKEVNQGVIDLLTTRIASINNIYNADKQAREKLYQANQDVGQTKLEEAKFNEDERMKLVLESTRIEADLVQAKNNIILNSDRTTLKQRLGAMESNLSAQRKIIAAERDNVLNSLTASDVDKKIATIKANEDLKKAEITNAESVRKEKETFYLRDLAAKKSILEQGINFEIEADKALSKDLNLSLEQRLDAYKKYVQDQKVLIDADYQYRLKQVGFSDKEIEEINKTGKYSIANKKVTDEELLAIQKDHENKILQLGVNAQKELTGVLRDEIEKRNTILGEQAEFIKRTYENMNISSTEIYAKDVIDLNKSLITKQISYKDYLIKRTYLDEKYSKDANDITIKQIKETLKLYKDAEENEESSALRLAKARIDLSKAKTPADKEHLSQVVSNAEVEYKIYKELADKKRKLEEDLTNDEKKNLEEYITEFAKIKDKEKQLLDAVGAKAAETFQALADSGFDAEKQRLQDQIDLVDVLKDKDIARINGSADAEEVKAARIKLVEAKAQSDKENLAKRQRELDKKKATFDKAFHAFSITVAGIEEVMKIKAYVAELIAKAAANPLLAPLIPVAAAQIPLTIALTAANVAAVLAAPIPAYASGVDSSPEGYALVGERGRELGISKSGKVSLYSQPTLAYLTGGTKILPNKVTEDTLNSAELMRANLMNSFNNNATTTDKDNEMLGLAVKELKELNSKSRIVIQNAPGIETNAYYLQQMKY